ncbi:hypothetical protein MJO28_017322 [Puccinia striiformis f. sp. tritici]|nr:hypothetical protein MJO28_017322 [Puccinia striiformis f. sp. tritici]
MDVFSICARHSSKITPTPLQSLKMAKSAHTSAASRRQTTKPTPLPTRAKITNSQEKEESSRLSGFESSESDVEFRDMPTSQPKKIDNNNSKSDKTPKKTENCIKSTNNVPENPQKSTKKIPQNINKSTKKIPEESSKKVSLKSAKKSEKNNEKIVKPVKKLDKKLEPVKIAKISLVIPRSTPENPSENSNEPIFHIQPPPQEIFQDQQECTQSIQQFALNRGYLIKIRNSCPTNTFYRCSRGGSASQNEHKDRKSKNPATSQLIGCPFEAKLIFQPASNNWLFTCTNPAHNHPEENNIDTSSQPLTLEIKEEIKELLRNGMKPKKIGEELQPEYPNHQITAARIYELGKQIKNQKTPENSLVQQLRESLAESSFFNETKYNKDGDINSIFFYHPLSFKLLSNYPKIIFVDSPANQNKYQMHLIHIAGLGGNNEQFSIAFSFISTRSIYSYSWTLQQFQSLFVDYHIPLPEIFTTLPDRHLQRSITKLFPKSQILLSTSHIEKDVRAKAKNYIQDIRDQGGAVTQWSSLIKKLTHTSFQQAFDHFKSQYPSHFIQSVIESRIPLSSLFLYHFTKDITHFNHTNLKLHLSHRYIDSLLLGTNPCPSVMLQSLSDSLKVKAQAILDNFDPEKLTKINSFFNNCLGKISNFALQKAQHNFTQTRESSPPTTCTNSHTTRTGIPCKHRILELLELGLLAQPEHFDPQWHLRVSLSFFFFGGGEGFLFKFLGPRVSLLGLLSV